LDNARLSLNVTNLTNERYVANFDNSVFAPTDGPGTVIVGHPAAPQQFFLTFGASL
jgi:iron complex outermembrane receptor protein